MLFRSNCELVRGLCAIFQKHRFSPVTLLSCPPKSRRYRCALFDYGVDFANQCAFIERTTTTRRTCHAKKYSSSRLTRTSSRKEKVTYCKPLAYFGSFWKDTRGRSKCCSTKSVRSTPFFCWDRNGPLYSFRSVPFRSFSARWIV